MNFTCGQQRHRIQFCFKIKMWYVLIDFWPRKRLIWVNSGLLHETRKSIFNIYNLQFIGRNLIVGTVMIRVIIVWQISGNIVPRIRKIRVTIILIVVEILRLLLLATRIRGSGCVDFWWLLLLLKTVLPSVGKRFLALLKIPDGWRWVAGIRFF